MKIFNAKEAANEYMSSHTLAFSTPELTLMRYSFWLGDIVPDSNDKEKTVPRIMTYIEEKDFEPVQVIDDDKYVPSGAVKDAGMYGSATTQAGSDLKFCAECGSKNSATARFCTECGANQV